jgi:hypothetical protein
MLREPGLDVSRIEAHVLANLVEGQPTFGDKTPHEALIGSEEISEFPHAEQTGRLRTESASHGVVRSLPHFGLVDGHALAPNSIEYL